MGVKERPILFNAEMVKAILDGRKTQTRRVVKEPYQSRWEKMLDTGRTFVEASGSGPVSQFCPYGVPGDGLWVKEKYRVASLVTAYEFDIQFDDDSYKRCDKLKGASEGNRPAGQWYPSIFMPRWASRITLEVKAVCVERVQEISGRDSDLEAVTIPDKDIAWLREAKGTGFDRHDIIRIRAFRELWDSINAKRGYGWDTNPWVFVIDFGRTE